MFMVSVDDILSEFRVIFSENGKQHRDLQDLLPKFAEIARNSLKFPKTNNLLLVIIEFIVSLLARDAAERGRGQLALPPVRSTRSRRYPPWPGDPVPGKRAV